MSSARSLLVAGLVALACLACCAAPAQAAPGDMVALGVGTHVDTLYSFSPASPATVTATPVVGLGGSDLVGIAYRPATLQLYGLGVNGNVTSLFTIDPATGSASAVGAPATISTLVGASAYGIAFNPAADRIRIVNNLASEVGTNTNNFRLNPNNGALAGSDTDLNYSALPGGSGDGPLVAVAYDRSLAERRKPRCTGSSPAVTGSCSWAASTEPRALMVASSPTSAHSGPTPPSTPASTSTLRPAPPTPHSRSPASRGSTGSTWRPEQRARSGRSATAASTSAPWRSPRRPRARRRPSLPSSSQSWKH